MCIVRVRPTRWCARAGYTRCSLRTYTSVFRRTIKRVLHITPHGEFTRVARMYNQDGGGGGEEEVSSARCALRYHLRDGFARWSTTQRRTHVRARKTRVHTRVPYVRASARMYIHGRWPYEIYELPTDAPSPATPTLLKLPRPRTMSPDTAAALIRPSNKANPGKTDDPKTGSGTESGLWK